MSGIQFHETRMGRTFIEHTVPELVRHIARLNDLLERLVDRLPEQSPRPEPQEKRP